MTFKLPTDRQIVESINSLDKQIIDGLIRKFKDRIFKIAMNFLLSEEKATIAVENALVSLVWEIRNSALDLETKDSINLDLLVYRVSYESAISLLLEEIVTSPANKTLEEKLAEKTAIKEVKEESEAC